ncbi:16S rRNA (cytidine(1402)-2'-O)-methyltransferase [Patescibacteria group bacterium]|nr:16S rRNA (cytidine(1402)-2'-O)-methyltransferase [Patescibacteria group bacterium]
MLYVTATPIGNLADITERAREIMGKVELVIAENPAYSKRLFDHLGLTGKKFMQFAEHNEEKQLPVIIGLLKNQDAILISDAGTPGISDPGFRLVRESVAQNIAVSPVPGPNAAIAALSASGLPTDRFVFLGFVPKSEIKLTNELQNYAELETTVIFYESPNRILKTLAIIVNTWPDARMAVARELTKMHEEFIRGSAAEVLEKLQARPSIKGEITVIISWK